MRSDARLHTIVLLAAVQRQTDALRGTEPGSWTQYLDGAHEILQFAEAWDFRRQLAMFDLHDSSPVTEPR